MAKYSGLKQAMRAGKKARKEQRSGIILMLACFCLPLLMTLMGLAIDSGVLYAVKTRLQMAVDGAALAGLRAMSLQVDPNQQAGSVSTVATRWFNANFAGNYLGATNTNLTTPTLDNSNNSHSVIVTATTDAPTYFMKYWARGATTISATGKAGRTDVNLMMVLDRSASMGSGSGSACASMITAAKQFTGMFTAGRDNVGLIAFASAVQVISPPTTTFQTTLGYSNSGGSASGALDNISCVGGTNTSAAISLAWNELYKMQLPGAFNVILLFTDGLPTAGIFNMRIPGSIDPSGNNTSALSTTSNCTDSNNKTYANSGDHYTYPRNWINSDGNVSAPSGPGKAIDLGSNSYWSPFYGEIAGIYGDSNTRNALQGGMPVFVPNGQTPGNYENTHKSTSEAPGCAFATGNQTNFASDIAFLPPTDLFGRSITGYRTLAMSNIQSAQRVSTSNSNARSNFVNVMANLADNAAAWARNPSINGTRINYTNGVPAAKTTFFVIGLGSNGGVDHTLLQRIANDPTGDPSGQNLWSPMTAAADQPVGYYYYAPSTTEITSAFSKLGSSTLRLAQ